MNQIPILKQLDTLTAYYDATRRTGHTTVMMRGVMQNDSAIIVVDQMSEADALRMEWGRKNIVTLPELHKKLRGVNAPLAIDNSALAALLSEAAWTIRKLQAELDELRAPNDKV